MRLPTTLECAIVMEPVNNGRQRLRIDASAGRSPLSPGRVPRIARLLALAHKFDGLLRQQAVADYAALACLGQVSRARITQIMNLLYLAPYIQEEILFLPPTVRGHDPIPLTRLHAIARILDWRRQRTRWRQLLNASTQAAPRSSGPSCCPL